MIAISQRYPTVSWYISVSSIHQHRTRSESPHDMGAMIRGFIF